MPSDAPSRFEIAFDSRRLAFKRAIFHWRTKLTGDSRLSSYPFISGDGFRALARFRFDTTDDIEAAVTELKDGTLSGKYHGATFDVKNGDIIFVASPIIKDFFEKVHPNISNPYVLITHNGDANIDENLFKFIDKKIIRSFAQNVIVSHPKITPIPIGLENLCLYQNGIVSYFKAMQKRLKGRILASNGCAKKARIFYHFKIRTNPDKRQPALDYFSRNPLTETMENKLSPRLYLKKLSSHMFMASPPGNGEDCIRTWEAMYLGVVPIVKRSIGMDYFKSLELPMLVVDEWTDLDEFDESKLRYKYEKITREARTEALYMEYWIKEIMAACGK